jgi:NAD(P)-dependent dehydrogenase (short-subunit alcohol dehydrogenase family)
VERVALISGGNRGLGREVARRLAEEGYQVVIGSRDLTKGEETAQELGERVTACRRDVTEAETIESCVDESDSGTGGWTSSSTTRASRAGAGARTPPMSISTRCATRSRRTSSARGS